jgi:hypothetical protein
VRRATAGIAATQRQYRFVPYPGLGIPIGFGFNQIVSWRGVAMRDFVGLVNLLFFAVMVAVCAKPFRDAYRLIRRNLRAGRRWDGSARSSKSLMDV